MDVRGWLGDRARSMWVLPVRTDGGCSGRTNGRSVLREHADDDATILGAAFLRLVGRDRLLHAVADHVHLVKRDLMLLEEIALDGFGALEADALIHLLRSDPVGVAFDLEIRALGVG